MNKSIKLMGAAVLVAAIIPLSAYAAAERGAKTDNLTNPAAVSSKLAQKAEGHATEKTGVIKKAQGLSLPWFDLTPVLEQLGFDKEGFIQALKTGRTLTDLAADKQLSREQLISVVSAGIDTNYDMAVQYGKLSQEDAEALKAKAKSGIDKLIDTPINTFSQEKTGSTETINLKSALDLLGIDKQIFVNARTVGKSLADIAAEKGVTRQQLTDSLSAQLNQTLEDAVRNGKLTNEDANNKKQSVLGQINKLIDDKGTAVEKG